MADISLRIKSDFAQAEKDFKNLSDMSESARAKIEQFTQGFKTEQIDKFIEKNKMTAAGVTATSGKFAGMQREAAGLQRQIQTLISKGLAPNDASVQKLSKEYDRLQKEMSQSSNQTTKQNNAFSDGVKKIAAYAAAYISFRAAVGFVKSLTVDLARQGDEIAKTSKMIGVNAEALQELRFAADRSGIASESLDRAFQDMNKSLGQVQAGTGRLTTFLKKSNPELLEQVKAANDSEEAFMMLSTAVKNTKNPMERAALATAAFGSQGQEIIKMAEEGEGGIAALREEARKYGNVMSTETAKASEKFVDAQTNVKNVLKGLALQMGAPMIAPIAKLLQRFADWASEGNRLLKIIKDIAPILLITTTAIIGYLAVTKGTILLTQAWTAAQTFLNAAMAANPIGLVVAGVIALGAAVALTLTKWDQFSTSIKVALSVIIGLFMGPFGLAAIHIIRNWEVVSAFFTGLFTGIRKEFNNFINYTSTLFSRYNPLSVVMRSFSGMRDFFAKIFGESGGFVEWFIKTVKFLFTSFTPLGLIIKNWRPLSGFFVSLWNGIKDTFQKGLQNIKSIIPDWMMRILQSGLANVKLTVTASKGVKDLQDRSAKGFNPLTTQPDGTAPAMPGSKGRDPQEEALKQKLERMAISEQAYNLQQTEDARNFYEKRADMEAVDGVNRLEWLMSQQEAIANMESLNREEKLTAERALTEAIIAEQKKLFDSRVSFAQQQLQTTGQMLSDLQTVFRNAGKESRALATLMKGVSIAEASINTYMAFTKALAAFPPPFNFVAAGVTLAAGMAKVAAIASTPIPTAQTGGTFTVPDMPAMRNDRAAVMASPGETVSVTPRGESGGMRETHVNIQIGESTLFRIIQTGIDTGKIVVSDRNIGRGVFA